MRIALWTLVVSLLLTNAALLYLTSRQSEMITLQNTDERSCVSEREAFAHYLDTSLQNAMNATEGYRHFWERCVEVATDCQENCVRL